MKPGHKLLVIINALVLLAFGALSVAKGNVEFVYYLVVVVILAGIVLASLKHVEYPNWVLWLLSGWAWAHMAGGLVPVNDSVLYNWIIVSLIGEPYNIFKYDQLVHAYGFFVATITFWYVLKPHLKKPVVTFGVGFSLLAIGMGLGALNEVVEFLAVVAIPDTNVGGYYNTGIDLIANLIGCVAAVILIRKKLSK